MLHIISVFCTVGNTVIFYWQKCSLFPFFVFGYYKQYSVKIYALSLWFFIYKSRIQTQELTLLFGRYMDQGFFPTVVLYQRKIWIVQVLTSEQSQNLPRSWKGMVLAFCFKTVLTFRSDWPDFQSDSGH